MFQSVFLVHSIHSCDRSLQSPPLCLPDATPSNVSCVARCQTKQLRLFWLRTEFMCHKNTSDILNAFTSQLPIVITIQLVFFCRVLVDLEEVFFACFESLLLLFFFKIHERAARERLRVVGLSGKATSRRSVAVLSTNNFWYQNRKRLARLCDASEKCMHMTRVRQATQTDGRGRPPRVPIDWSSPCAGEACGERTFGSGCSYGGILSTLATGRSSNRLGH